MRARGRRRRDGVRGRLAWFSLEGTPQASLVVFFSLVLFRRFIFVGFVGLARYLEASLPPREASLVVFFGWGSLPAGELRGGWRRRDEKKPDEGWEVGRKLTVERRLPTETLGVEIN